MAVTEFLDMTVEEFRRWDCAVEVAVPWLGETLWFVPRVEHISVLMADGIRRGRIWTAGELTDLATIPGLTRTEIESIGRLKAAFGAEILSIGPDAATDINPSQHKPFKQESRS